MATLDNQIDNFLGAIGEEVMVLEKRWALTLNGKGERTGLARSITFHDPKNTGIESVSVFLAPDKHGEGYHTAVETLLFSGVSEFQNFSSKTPSEIIAGFIFSRFM